MRKAVVLGAVIAAVMLSGAVLPVGAQVQGTTTFVIRKVVQGPATAGTTVRVTCETLEDASVMAEAVVDLGFDATGAPTTSTEPFFVIEDGAWVHEATVPPSELDNPVCTATEIETGGAASTSWTCDFELDAGTEPTGLGCAADAGTGVGPVSVVFGDTSDEVLEQTWTVVFTNTHPEPVVEVVPTFTG